MDLFSYKIICSTSRWTAVKRCWCLPWNSISFDLHKINYHSPPAIHLSVYGISSVHSSIHIYPKFMDRVLPWGRNGRKQMTIVVGGTGESKWIVGINCFAFAIFCCNTYMEYSTRCGQCHPKSRTAHPLARSPLFHSLASWSGKQIDWAVHQHDHAHSFSEAPGYCTACHVELLFCKFIIALICQFVPVRSMLRNWIW